MSIALMSGCDSRSHREATADGREAGSTDSSLSTQAGAAPFTIENSAVLPIRSKILGRDYEIFVKTPPGYDKPENAGRRYPVIYLTDGPYTFQVASGVSRVPFSQDRFNPFIIVGLSWALGEVPADSRRRDLTPWVSPAVAGTTGGGPAFLAFLKSEAMPLVESRYRIDGRERALAGQSYGGVFGLWVALTEPQLFKTYILTSPSIWFADRSILKTEAAYAAAHKDLKARIYLATGSREHPGADGCAGCENDMVADQRTLTKALADRDYAGLQLKAEVVQGSFHETTFPIGLINGMQWTYLKP
ncbi:alpha/beta hydrolase [Altericroceibacterium xinjiangense]|uniref:alpha/beta hydrolase n=1 Tax=Altericroceibacterium xinjiangense TaxID=762261 RepID=UPI001F494F30|nr:alpha/beta hydrolase-fold protein [Altericroceibacterium xinjiangense]